jgi:hypothetical protein
MYLSKQWRESRNISIIGLLGLIVLLFATLKAKVQIDSAHGFGNEPGAFALMFVALFYIESVFVAFWGWLEASIGVGVNLGEGSGSFLLTRPRRRAWFLWSDWGFSVIQIAAITLLANLIVGLLLEHIRTLMHITGGVRFVPDGNEVSVFSLLLLISICVWLFSGLVYSVTYFSTILMKRLGGVILGAGILVGYSGARALIGHYYPSIQLPNPIPNLFKFHDRRFYGFSDHIGLSLAIRAAVMLAFPVAAQIILDRSEI